MPPSLPTLGGVAQLGERRVRNAEVVGSSPIFSIEVPGMKPPSSNPERTAGPSASQLEITKSVIAATAEITASMVHVTHEKNPAKISEAYRVIYKAIMETVKGQTSSVAGVAPTKKGSG